MTGWWVFSLCPTTSTTHTLKLYIVHDTRNCAAVSKACLPNSLVSAVSAPAIEPNEAISARGLCSKKFRSRVSETGSMTAWGVGSLVQMVSTTHTLKLYRVRGTRNSAAISKTCPPNSLASAVSAPAIQANEPISPPGLCSKKFRSWLEFRRLVLRGELAVWSRWSSPTEPWVSRKTPNRPFLRGYPLVSFRPFGLCRH